VNEAGHDKKHEYFDFCHIDGLALKKKVHDLVEEEFAMWMKHYGVTLERCSDPHLPEIVDGYFTGAPPFKQAKNRNDFPDAFIWHTVLDLKSQFTDLRFVVNDGGYGESREETWYFGVRNVGQVH
jgi:hypothetical protein